MHGAAFANWAVNGEFEQRKSFNEPMKQDRARRGFAAGVWRALRRPRDRQGGQVLREAARSFTSTSTRPRSTRTSRPICRSSATSNTRSGRLNEMIARAADPEEVHGLARADRRRGRAKAPFGYRVTEEVMKSQHMRDHLKGRESEVILPQMAIEMLYELTKGEAIITTGVGQHQMWAGAVLQVQIPAPVPDQRRPGRDGLRLSRRARRQSGAARTSR